MHLISSSFFAKKCHFLKFTIMNDSSISFFKNEAFGNACKSEQPLASFFLKKFKMSFFKNFPIKINENFLF